MDLSANPWLGNVSQRFEALCVEVKSVGDCVKKFCSDAVDELLPLSSDDLMQQENPEWNLVYNFYMGNICEKPIIRNQFKSKQNVSESCNLSNLSESPSLDSTCLNDKPEEKLHPSDISVLIETPTEDGVATAAIPGSLSALLSEIDERRCLLGPVICDGFENVNDTLKKSDVESIVDVKEEHQAHVSEQLGKMKRNESGELVEKCDHIFPEDLQGKERSYKEKIQDVFHLRKRSSSKWSSSPCQEQRKSCHQSKKSSNQDESEKIMNYASPCESLSESGWELL